MTGSMNSPRIYATATLLQNGLVLVAGGYATTGAYGLPISLASAELYNPSTGKWTTTGSMKVGRYGHEATLLQNGQVFVVGGQTARGYYTPSAELYNPSTGTWTASGRMNLTRYAFQATPLQNGQVLVAGGYSTTQPGTLLAEAELHNPCTGKWTTTGSMNEARALFTATLLSNGQVLAAGGNGNVPGGDIASAELYNPSTGTWTTTGSMNVARLYHTATPLTNGEVLVAGGSNSTTVGPLAEAELYNPSTGTWTTTGSMNVARGGQTATLLQNGQVLVVGGRQHWLARAQSCTRPKQPRAGPGPGCVRGAASAPPTTATPSHGAIRVPNIVGLRPSDLKWSTQPTRARGRAIRPRRPTPDVAESGHSRRFVRGARASSPAGANGPPPAPWR